MMHHLEDWGSPTTFPHFAIGWAWATNTPFQWTKQVASHFGGTRNGMVMHWPKGIKPASTTTWDAGPSASPRPRPSS